jgi:hypothetical protein
MRFVGFFLNLKVCDTVFKRLEVSQSLSEALDETYERILREMPIILARRTNSMLVDRHSEALQ